MLAYGSTPVVAASLEERITAIEREFQDVKQLKGIPGPRGPAGHIEAAVDQSTKAANQAVSNAEALVTARAAEEFSRFAAEITKLQKFADDLRKEFADHKKYLHDIVKNEVDLNVVQTLHDYLLLAENGEPSFWGKK